MFKRFLALPLLITSISVQAEVSIFSNIKPGCIQKYDKNGIPITLKWSIIANEQEFDEKCKQFLPILTSTIIDFVNETKKHWLNRSYNFVVAQAKKEGSTIAPEKYATHVKNITAQCDKELAELSIISALHKKSAYKEALKRLREYPFSFNPSYELQYPGESLIIEVKSTGQQNLAFAIFGKNVNKMVVSPQAHGRDLIHSIKELVHKIATKLVPHSEPEGFEIKTSQNNSEALKWLYEKIGIPELGNPNISISEKKDFLSDPNMRNGKVPLHELIRNIDDYINQICPKKCDLLHNEEKMIQAIKNAVPTWTYAYGRTFCCNIPDMTFSWDADCFNKDEMLDIHLHHLKGARANYTDTLKSQSKMLIKTLLEGGALIDFPDQYGRTALWWAAENNQLELMSILIEEGANINGFGKQIPLIIAAYDCNKESVEILLDHGADLNLVDEDGETALHAAARGDMWLYPSHDPKYKRCSPEKLQDYKEIIASLIRRGAFNNVKNAEGLTPSQAARAQQKEFYPEHTDFILADYIEQLTNTTQK